MTKTRTNNGNPQEIKRILFVDIDETLVGSSGPGRSQWIEPTKDKISNYAQTHEIILFSSMDSSTRKIDDASADKSYTREGCINKVKVLCLEKKKKLTDVRIMIPHDAISFSEIGQTYRDQLRLKGNDAPLSKDFLLEELYFKQLQTIMNCILGKRVLVKSDPQNPWWRGLIRKLSEMYPDSDTTEAPSLETKTLAEVKAHFAGEGIKLNDDVKKNISDYISLIAVLEESSSSEELENNFNTFLSQQPDSSYKEKSILVYAAVKEIGKVTVKYINNQILTPREFTERTEKFFMAYYAIMKQIESIPTTSQNVELDIEYLDDKIPNLDAMHAAVTAIVGSFARNITIKLKTIEVKRTRTNTTSSYTHETKREKSYSNVQHEQAPIKEREESYSNVQHEQAPIKDSMLLTSIQGAFGKTYGFDGLDKVYPPSDNTGRIFDKTCDYSHHPITVITSLLGLPNTPPSDGSMKQSADNILSNLIGWNDAHYPLFNIVKAPIALVWNIATAIPKMLLNVIKIVTEFFPLTVAMLCYEVGEEYGKNNKLIFSIALSGRILFQGLAFIGAAITSPIDNARNGWRLGNKFGGKNTPEGESLGAIFVVLSLCISAAAYTFAFPLAAKVLGSLILSKVPAVVGNALTRVLAKVPSTIPNAVDGLATAMAIGVATNARNMTNRLGKWLSHDDDIAQKPNNIEKPQKSNIVEKSTTGSLFKDLKITHFLCCFGGDNEQQPKQATKESLTASKGNNNNQHSATSPPPQNEALNPVRNQAAP